MVPSHPLRELRISQPARIAPRAGSFFLAPAPAPRPCCDRSLPDAYRPLTGNYRPRTDEPPWLTLNEAAERSGTNRETLRSRARRGLLNSRRGNTGQLLVQLPGVTEPDRPVTA